VEDADEAIADLAQGGVVADLAASELVVVGADTGVPALGVGDTSARITSSVSNGGSSEWDR
jgi:hypothetical protein